VTTTQLKVSEAAALAGVRPQVIDGAQFARLLQELSTESPLAPTSKTSTRNRLVGIVTRVTKDGVMAQVDLQAGPFRIVSLISREAVDELGIEVGTVAAATVKATSVSISLP
jgi:molybdopterin-binding protein